MEQDGVGADTGSPSTWIRNGYKRNLAPRGTTLAQGSLFLFLVFIPSAEDSSGTLGRCAYFVGAIAA